METKSKVKHTAGEWKAVISNDLAFPFEILNTSEFSTLAKVTNLNRSGSAASNAKLIAAAPELLAALQSLLATSESWACGVQFPSILAAKAAIAKATE